MFKIVSLLILTPIIDLYILIKASREIGFLNTILLIIATGVIGYILAKSEGRVILRRIREELFHGNIPGGEILTGLCILIGGLLLLLPGILTDIVGITMILPGTRNFYKEYMKAKFASMIKRGNTTFFFRW